MSKQRSVWEKIKGLPFKDELIEDLKADVMMPVVRHTAHATHIAEGRRELALELLARLGAL